LLQRVALPLLALLAIRPSYVVAQPISPPNLTDPSAAITATLPANVAGVLFVNTSTEAWTTLTQFQLFSEAGPFLAGLPSLFLGFDLTTDVQPWLGDRVAIVVMPYQEPKDSPANSSNPEPDSEAKPTNPANTELANNDSTLLLAPIKDASAFKSFVDKLKVSRGQVPVERQYKGITVWEWPTEQPAPCDGAAPDEAGCTPADSEANPEAIPEAPGAEPIQPSQPSSEPDSQTRSQTHQAFSKLKAVSSAPNIPLPSIPGGAIPIPSIPSARPGLAIAVLPGYLVTATSAAPIEQFIDARSSNGPALSANPQFQRTMQNPQFQRSLLVGYGNIAEIARFPQPQFPIPTTPPAEEPTSPQPQTALPRKLKAASEPNNPAPMQGLNAGLERIAEDYTTVDGYVWLQPEGIRTQISSYYKTPQPASADVLTPNADQILTRLPGATYLASTSRNLKQQWQSFVEITQAEPTLEPALQVIRDGIRKLSGLDLERDWLPWMDGEYAAFLFPSNQGPLSRLYPNLDLGVGLVMQTSDRPAAEAALKKFDQFVKSQAGGSLDIATRTIKGQPVTSWEFEEAGDRQSFFAHSWVDQDTLVVTTGLGSMQALSPKPYLPLDQNRTFKTATDTFARPNQGYFYTNWGASLSFLYGLFQPYSNAPEMKEVKQWLGTVYSISASNSATPEKQQFDSLLILAPTRKP